MEDFIFYAPTKIIFGEDCIDKNKELIKKYGKKTLIITYEIPGGNKALDDVVNTLKEIGTEYLVYTDVEANPSLETIEKAAKVGQSASVDFIIAVGGGSPIDAAKAIGVLLANPEIDGMKLFEDSDLKSLPLIAVSTTAGTGAEVAHFSIVTRNDIHTKQAISPRIFPDIAFLDAKYLMGTPEAITKSTAIDALCHSIESYISTAGSLLSRALCEMAFKLFSECHEDLRNNNFTYELREKLMLISTLGGLANTQTGSSLPHGMSYSLTHFKNVPHGVACGLLEKEYLEIFKDRTKVDKIMELTGFGDVGNFGSFIDECIDFKIDITEEEIDEYATQFASQKHRFKRHPEPAGKEEVLQIYKKSLLKNKF